MQKTKNKLKKYFYKANKNETVAEIHDDNYVLSFCKFVFYEYSVLTCSSLRKQHSTPIPTPPLILVAHTVSTCPHAVCLVTCTNTQCGLQKVLKFKRCQTPKHATCYTSCDCYQETFESYANKKPVLPTIFLVMAYQHFRLGGAQGVVDMKTPEAQTLFQSFEPMS